jgi:diadenosine tetraphosphatase ApaH/serine/threonine PP2A family protein phosphatase
LRDAAGAASSPHLRVHEPLRYAILADIHSNLEALEAVLAALSKSRIDRYVCVGDVVGYGADPKPCIDRVRDICSVTIAGNHDWAVAGTLSLEFFNGYAREAIRWTRERLEAADLAWLRDLPLEHDLEGLAMLVHSTLHNPAAFDYLLTSYDAHLTMRVLERPLCFVGHSHIPITFMERNGLGFTFADMIDLTKVDKAIINPGSVGQPRDENPAAAYAVYDTVKRRVTLHRVPYDLDACCSKIERAGLPQVLADRLRVGK